MSVTVGLDEARLIPTIHGLIEQALRGLLKLPGESSVDPVWAGALENIRSYTVRPSKRVRPLLLVLAHMVTAGNREAPDGLWQFAAAAEVLHAFTLVHDDIADGAELRRGGPTMHRMLGTSKVDEDRAVVIGDYLFSLAIESMLQSGLAGSSAAAARFIGLCRHTAIGQFLDLTFTRAPLSSVTVFRSLRVALLKTALYGFSAPMTGGAILAGGSQDVIDAFHAAGCHFGRAYQLTDDLIGLYGDPHTSGKSTTSDLGGGKRSFPVVVAYRNAPPAVKVELEALWSGGPHDETGMQRARALVEDYGGRATTERFIRRSTARGMVFLRRLPNGDGTRDVMARLFDGLVGRVA